MQEKIHIGAKAGGEVVQLTGRQRMPEHLVEAEEGVSGIPAATAEPGGQWDLLVEVDGNTVRDPREVEETPGRSVDEV